ERALACWHASNKNGPEVFQVLPIALIELERSGDAAALKALDAPYTIIEYAGEHRRDTYAACVESLRECLKTRGSVPPRTGEIKRWVLDTRSGVYRGNVCYIFGRLCELRGRADEAKFWY